MLLSSSSLTEFANRLEAMIFINRQDVQLGGEIRGLRADTQLKQDEPSAKEKETLGLGDQITSQRGPLTAEKGRYDKLVAEAQAAIGEQAGTRAGAAANKQNAQGQIVQSKGQTAELQRQLNEAEARYEMLAAAAAGGGGYGGVTGSEPGVGA